MWQTFFNILDLPVATAVLALLLLLPGAAIGAFTGWLGTETLGRRYCWGNALLFALAVLPALLSLIARLASLDAAVAVQLALALIGVFAVRRMGPPPLAAILGLLACSLVIAFAFVDIRFGGGLYQPSLVLDMVKHVATVNSIVSWGLPLTDPFVSRVQPAGYYYFFYTVAAVPVRLTLGAIDARAAVGGLATLDGAGLVALAFLLWQKIAAGPALSRNAVWALVALLVCGNLDIVAGLVIGLIDHRWPIQIEWWNEQILPWTMSLLWVPHHVLALIAGVFGLILICERPRARSCVVAGFAFASCAGASLWVGLAIALAALFWLVSLIRRQPRMALILGAAGCLATLVLVAQILDLLHGRTYGAFPIAITIRVFAPVDRLVAPGIARELLRGIFLPVNYLAEFGIFAVGAVIYCFERRVAVKTEAGLVLALVAAAGLLLGTFTASTLINNDLGWRAMLLPQLAFLIWTAAVIVEHSGSGRFRIRDCRRWPAAMGALLLIGYAGTLYELVAMRVYPFLEPNVTLAPQIAFNPAVDAALSSAYAWANTHLPRNDVLQHNPVGNGRVVDFGLYGRNRVAVADGQATLYGASRGEVERRVAAIAPIFTRQLSAAAVRARASSYGIDVLVVSSADPVWSDRRDWVWSTRALLALPQVRLIATRDLAPEH